MVTHEKIHFFCMFSICPLCNCRTLSRAYKNIYYYTTVCSRQRKQIWLLKKISILNWFPQSGEILPGVWAGHECDWFFYLICNPK